MPKTSIVVGSGVFGIATVKALLNDRYDVTWIDDEHSGAASAGHRIFREKYTDDRYREMAQEARGVYTTDERFPSFYHETQWVLVQRKEALQQGISSDGEEVSPVDFQKKFPGAKTDGVTITMSDGVALLDAGDLRQEIIRTLEGRVTREVGLVKRLIVQRGTCTGVEYTKNGELVTLTSDMVVLACGWRTNTLLTQSQLQPLPYKVVGITSIGITPPNTHRHYLSGPILCVPGFGEMVPVEKDNILIINSHESYEFLSTLPPNDLDSSHPCFKRNFEFIEQYFPDLTEPKVVFARVICDAFTKSQSPFAHEVNGANHVWAAGGGSLHFFKFIPNLHRHIAEPLGLCKGDGIWAALTNENSPKHPDLAPRREWNY